MSKLILCVFLISCGTSQNVIFHEPELYQIIERFNGFSGQWNLPSASNVSVRWKDLPKEEWGACEVSAYGMDNAVIQYTDSTNYDVYISNNLRDLWLGDNFYEREFVRLTVYHELVHCAWQYFGHVESGLMAAEGDIAEFIKYEHSADLWLITFHTKHIERK